MNFERVILEHARTAVFAIALCSVAAVCVRSYWRNASRINWKSLLAAFSFSVLALSMTSTISHEYAYWRVSVYDANGDQHFSNDGRIDSRTYDRLMHVAVNDAGNSLQPLGATIVSLVFILIGQALAYMLTPIRLAIQRRK